MQKALAEDNFTCKRLCRRVFFSLLGDENYFKKFFFAKGSTGVNCTVRRAPGEDNSNILKVSGGLGFVTHIASRCTKNWGQGEICLVQWLKLRKLHSAKGSSEGKFLL